MDFSVLMSVYWKEVPAFFRQSLDSVFAQTRRAAQVVLVEDGPLTSELDDVVAEYKERYPELDVVPLAQNGGLGRALNEGLKHCRYDLVARMDADDISKPFRFERQVEFMEKHPEVDVCSAAIDEFDGCIDNIVSTRTLPSEHGALFLFGKRRNPINHPVSIFRKSAVEAAGSYQHFNLFEDYYLWARMMVRGAKFHNIEESLLYFRQSPQMMKRRGGWKYAWTEAKFQFAMYKIGYVSLLTMVENIFIRFGLRIMPNGIRTLVYSKMLR